MLTSRLPLIQLTSCPKGYQQDLDKVVPPEDTIFKVKQRLKDLDLDLLSSTQRIDQGRLGIPVYLSVCGSAAKNVMPTRKQMGKGSSPKQAEASAIMELVERYSFFTYLQENKHLCSLTFAEASARFGEDKVLPLEEMLRSVQEDLELNKARSLLENVRFTFAPATELFHEKIVWLPLNWFKLLNEFNGTSAGNTIEEALLQGLCEVIERHVCAEISEKKLERPSIDLESCQDPTLRKLIYAFQREGIKLILKDFSLDLPLPTVAALAWDPATFPKKSEIVFTAGTASQPAKAAIRAITEVAQLGGDFCTNSCYEASGLPKYTNLKDLDWILKGPLLPLSSLKDAKDPDISKELKQAICGLAPKKVYSLLTTEPRLQIPATYTIVPGLAFRERDQMQSLGLFLGRLLTEEGTLAEAALGLEKIAKIYGPKAHFIPFFQGMLALKSEDLEGAKANFTKALPLQPTSEAQALTYFYRGYTSTLESNFKESIKDLEEAHKLEPTSPDYANFLGVSLYKTGDYAKAKEIFSLALKLDKGSAMTLANLGRVHEVMGEEEKAMAFYEKATALDPSLAFAREKLQELRVKKKS